MSATLMSIAEFELLPDEPGKQELLQGEVISLPPAGESHNVIAHALFGVLVPVFAARRVRIDAGYRMSRDTWLEPDVSLTWPDQPVVNDFMQGSPMIAVEVISPSNLAEEIARKAATYLKHGAEEVWIIYPRTRSMMVHRRSSVEHVTDTYRSALVPVAISLNDILPAE